MPTTRNFAYNTGTTFSGSEQVGFIAADTPIAGLTATGVTWRSGPDEDPGFVIAYPTSGPRTAGGGTEIISGTAIGYKRTVSKTEESFLNLANGIGSTTFATGSSAKTWLNSNGYWTSWPGIVQSGLVLNLDASNRDSYPGTGNTWFDISGSTANMTLNNGPVFVNNGSASYFLFDGVNDNGTATVQVPDSNPGDRCCFDAWCYGPITNGVMLMSWGTGIHDIWIYGGGIGFNTYNSDVYGRSVTGLSNVWFNMTVNFYRNDYTLGSIFVNGVQQNLSYFSSLQNTSNARFAGGLLRIASGGDGYHGLWRFNSVKVYNRALSQSEVLQNYNSLKYRFGL
jgi:hypothetical protein